MPDHLYRILIADDDEDIVDFVSTYLVDEAYETVCAYNGEEALARFQEADRSASAADRIHLVLLDVAMPRVDGFEVCRRIRKDSTVPIIMLTARAEFRLHLRADNAETRLGAVAARLGCLGPDRAAHQQRRRASRQA